jgi:dTMP kinase
MSNHITGNKNGIMIVIDGGNGACKSTVIEFLEKHLIDKGHSVVLTREPGGTSIDDQIREVVLKKVILTCVKSLK